ncbi:hypothetical protein GIS00_04830 [Nakamurella sp. YIM 132087]|uniref:FAD-binding FR-type domain-containing protein n=1 Tax=Nakamurella alba TaxID=2665158 RepID=A0A7K1FGN6_9ACTN|nr:siderophore-interacting protein [Nakamurella alba]MTD13272.1 hypothetical protein [Nakamurella alba]
MKYYRAQVLRTAYVTPKMIRVTLGGDELAGYEAEGHPDDYCKVLFPHPGESDVVVPVLVDGIETAPDGRAHAERRSYSIRRYDPVAREVDIDFAVHDHGLATRWAAGARPGDPLALSDAGGGYHPPAGTTEVRLVGDSTSLPAIGRILAEAPAGLRILATVVVPDAGEEQVLPSAADVHLEWVHVPDPRQVGAAMEAALRALPEPAGDSYTWVAGENTACRKGRAHLRRELGLPGRQYHTLGYWRVDEETWSARYEEVGGVVEERIDVAAEQIADDEELVDEIERIYDEAGLGW